MKIITSLVNETISENTAGHGRVSLTVYIRGMNF